MEVDYINHRSAPGLPPGRKKDLETSCDLLLGLDRPLEPVHLHRGISIIRNSLPLEPVHLHRGTRLIRNSFPQGPGALGSECMVQGSGFQVWGLEVRVGSRVRISGFGCRLPPGGATSSSKDNWFWVSRPRFRAPDFSFRVPGLEFRVSGVRSQD